MNNLYTYNINMTTTFLKQNYDNFVDFVKNNAKRNGLFFITNFDKKEGKEIKTHITQHLNNDGDAVALLSNRTQKRDIKYSFEDVSTLVKECAEFYKKDFSPRRTSLTEMIPGKQYKRIQINAASHNFNSGAGMFIARDMNLTKDGMICIGNQYGGNKYRFLIDKNDIYHFECKRNNEKLDSRCIKWAIDAINNNNKVVYLFLERNDKFFEYLGQFTCVGIDYLPNSNKPERAFLNLKKINNLEINEINNDIDLVKDDKHIDATTKQRLIDARVGQGDYRESLLKKFNHTCAITGIHGLDQLLIASHIQAWAASTNEERLDSENGLLLSATYDKLFDKYLISFTNDGKLIVSDLIPQEIKQALQLIPGKQFDIKPSKAKSKYLVWHRLHLKK